ncbi:hypothetical protein LSTR_LSTR013091 [Laodelphax striatellus]|uniref:Protein SPT2 homolog n=1 Tax=Laodelphax striatellus TaxID=195883 RepID=A0A482XMV9_LAOST|nr:hypothetical protein LSTR_LSTR013091 [Laodelphax striatellus]
MSTLDFGSILYAAQNNTGSKSKETPRCYKTTFEPPKKEVKPKQLSANVQKFLQKQEEEKRRKEIEAKKKREELLALRSQDKMSQKRMSTMLKRTKSANKSVMEDAIDDVNTSVTMNGPQQCDEDDYGYVSQEASSFYNKMMEKYTSMPSDEPSFLKPKKGTAKDLSAAKERVKAALNRVEEEEMMPRKRKRKTKESEGDKEEDDFIDDSGINYKRGDEDREREKEKEKEKKKPKRPPMPPPMDFQSLLKLAEQKQHEPVVIDKKRKRDSSEDEDEEDEDEERKKLMTKRQRIEYEREKEARMQRERRRIEREKEEAMRSRNGGTKQSSEKGRDRRDRKGNDRRERERSSERESYKRERDREQVRSRSPPRSSTTLKGGGSFKIPKTSDVSRTESSSKTSKSSESSNISERDSKKSESSRTSFSERDSKPSKTSDSSRTSFSERESKPSKTSDSSRTSFSERDSKPSKTSDSSRTSFSERDSKPSKFSDSLRTSSSERDSKPSKTQDSSRISSESSPRIPKLSDKTNKPAVLDNKKRLPSSVVEEKLKKSSDVWAKPCNLSPSSKKLPPKSTTSTGASTKPLEDKLNKLMDEIRSVKQASTKLDLEDKLEMLSRELEQIKRERTRVENGDKRVEKSNGALDRRKDRDENSEKHKYIPTKIPKDGERRGSDVPKPSSSSTSSKSSDRLKDDRSPKVNGYKPTPINKLNSARVSSPKPSKLKSVDLFGEDFPDSTDSADPRKSNGDYNKPSMAASKQSSKPSLAKAAELAGKQRDVKSSQKPLPQKASSITSSKSASSGSSVQTRKFPPDDLKPRPGDRARTSGPVRSRQFPPPDVRSRQFPPNDVRSRRPSPPRSSRYYADEDEEDEYDSEMDDFIDYGDGDEEDREQVSEIISQLFKYNPSQFSIGDDDDECMESNFGQIDKEEIRSLNIGLREDLEDIRREQAEKREAQRRKLEKMAAMKKNRR